MPRTLFAMVSLSVSKPYTKEALRTFFRTTPLGADDQLVLIDNDGSAKEFEAAYPQLERVVPAAPQSFAQNVNGMIKRARELDADLLFMNNDLLFSSGWYQPFQTARETLLSPLSNREIHPTIAGQLCTTTLNLGMVQALGESFEAELDRYALQLRQQGERNLAVMMLPFFCILIPRKVYEQVGPLDERFGRGGAEDADYCLRALLAGFTPTYLANSFIIHFNGKSTWAGAETKRESEERCQQFRSEFTTKWNSDLAELFVGGDPTVLERYPAALRCVQAGSLTGAAQQLVANLTTAGIQIS